MDLGVAIHVAPPLSSAAIIPKIKKQVVRGDFLAVKPWQMLSPSASPRGNGPRGIWERELRFKRGGDRRVHKYNTKYNGVLDAKKFNTVRDSNLYHRFRIQWSVILDPMISLDARSHTSCPPQKKA
jgi:hypothetical protein